MDEAADIYLARATRLLLDGPAADRQVLVNAKRTALRTRRLPEYEQARRAAALAWRGALPGVQGPWLIVGSAIANAAGALVLQDVLDPKEVIALLGPWRQAIGSTVPVGPGQLSHERVPPLLR
jgi:hypothetical protein